LAAVFQSPEPGLRSHSALPASVIAESKNIRPLPVNAVTNFFIELILRLLPIGENYQPRKTIGPPFEKT
jgi:hypothetical protein